MSIDDSEVQVIGVVDCMASVSLLSSFLTLCDVHMSLVMSQFGHGESCGPWPDRAGRSY